jgi:hypothetical protein
MGEVGMYYTADGDMSSRTQFGSHRTDRSWMLYAQRTDLETWAGDDRKQTFQCKDPQKKQVDLCSLVKEY